MGSSTAMPTTVMGRKRMTPKLMMRTCAAGEAAAGCVGKGSTLPGATRQVAA
jgi:hypothetical protein